VTRSFAGAALAATILATFSACAQRTHLSPPLRSTVTHSNRSLVVDSVAARLVATELARASRRAVYEDWAPEVLGLNARIVALQEQLLANSSTASIPRAVMQDVLTALEQRRAQLVVEHRQLLVKYYPQAEPVLRNVAEQVAVEARRDELHASLGIAAANSGTR